MPLPVANETIIQLPSTMSVDTIASACRETWRRFVESSLGWGKSELVMWSLGNYARITRLASNCNDAEQQLMEDFRTVDARFIDRLVRTARAKVVETLWSFGSQNAQLDFAMWIRSERLVLRCTDSANTEGWLPVAIEDRLTDRVLSLIGADLLTRPQDFARDVLCADCGGVAIGPAACCIDGASRRGTSSAPQSWKAAG